MTEDRIISTEGKKTFIFQTSGSTGEPKIVKKDYENLVAEAQDMADFFNVSKDTTIVSTVSPEHMFGTTFNVMLPKVAGCKVEPERVFYPEDLKDYGKYIFVTTPSFLEKLAKYKFTFKYKPIMIITAGAHLSDDVFEYFEKMCPVTDVYGSSETGVMAYRKSYKDLLKPFDNVQFEQRNGDVVVKSEYFSEPEFVLGDDLEFYNDGFRVKGRKDRIVKIQEKRVSLDFIENNLKSNNLIEKAYCLNIDDKLCATVVLNSEGRKFLKDKGKSELLKELKIFAKFNCFGEVIRCKRWRFLYDLPINNSGKVDGKRIREIFDTNVTYPNIIDYSLNNNIAQFCFVFPQNSNFFKGHFTDFPILPGVVQLFFAKEFIKDVFHLDFAVQKVKKVKFSSIIKPEMQVCMSLERKESSVDFKYFKDDKVFSSGTFVL